MLNNYSAIPEFGQCIEYITQVAPDGNGYYDVKINTMPLSNFDLAGVKADTNVTQTIDIIFRDFVKVLSIKSRQIDLTSADYNVVIPTAIRLKLNLWLTANGFTPVGAISTYKQILDTMRAKLIA